MTHCDNSLPWKCPKHTRSRALASTFLEVGETDRPRFSLVYSAILGAGYSYPHFSAPLSLSLVFYSWTRVLLFCLFILALFLCPLSPLSTSPLILKTYIEVTLNGGDTFRQLLRYHMLLSNMGSDGLAYLKKTQCNPLSNFTFCFFAKTTALSFTIMRSSPADNLKCRSIMQDKAPTISQNSCLKKTSLISHQSLSSLYAFQGVWCGSGWFNTSVMRQMWSWIGNESMQSETWDCWPVSSWHDSHAHWDRICCPVWLLSRHRRRVWPLLPHNVHSGSPHIYICPRTA